MKPKQLFKKEDNWLGQLLFAGLPKELGDLISQLSVNARRLTGGVVSQVGDEVQGFPVKGVVAITITAKMRFHNNGSLGLNWQVEDAVFQNV